MKWPMVKIAEICKTGSGGTPSRSNPEFYQGDIPWIKSGDLREKLVTEASEFLSELAIQKSSAKIVPKGAILLAMYGATVGRMALLGIDAATNQAVCNIIPDESKAFPKYVYYALLSKVPYFLNNAIGGAQPNISQGMIKDTEIPLPPLEEQKRIAAILDKADAIRRKRQQAIKLADDFLRSVFLDMFGDPVTNLKGGRVVPLIELCNKVTDGTHQSPKWEDNGIPFLFISNIVNGKINFDTNKFISKETLNELTRSTPIEKEDILYTTVGSYGNVARVTDDTEFCFQRHIAHIKPNHDLVKAEFLAGMLSSSVIRRQADGLVRGVAQKTLNLRELKEILVFDVSLDDQKKYLDIVEPLRRAKENYEQSFSELIKNFNSLSQKAFLGEF